MREMRGHYHEQLNEVIAEIVSLTQMVQRQVRRATSALLEPDIRQAEDVIAADRELDQRCELVEQQVFDVIARQSPVAGDLRTLVSTLRMTSDLDRMGDLSAHVAKVARLRYPSPAIPAELYGPLRQMGQHAEAMVGQAAQVVKDRDVDAARKLEASDDQMDLLRRQLFRSMMDKQWAHGVEAAVDIALLGRYYERIADHAVSMARRVIYLVSGTLVGGVGGENG